MKDALTALEQYLQLDQEKFYLNTDVIIPAPSEDSICRQARWWFLLVRQRRQMISFSVLIFNRLWIRVHYCEESTADEREVLWDPNGV